MTPNVRTLRFPETELFRPLHHLGDRDLDWRLAPQNVLVLQTFGGTGKALTFFTLVDEVVADLECRLILDVNTQTPTGGVCGADYSGGKRRRETSVIRLRDTVRLTDAVRNAFANTTLCFI